MSFVSELKRRKVLRVAAVYASAAFAAVEGLDLLVETLGVPPSTLRVATILALGGFPVAVGLAWVFDLDRSGVRATAGADTPEGRAELEAAAGLSLLDGRTMLLAGALLVFGLGLGTGVFLTPPSTAPTVDEGPSIAVLPFENRSSDEDAVFFVDGIHDEVLNQLSKIHALRVISRSSVMGYREAPKPVRVVAEELGVRTVLEGGVQRAGDQVRISVQLVDALNDAQLWAQSYEESLSPENIFAIQRDVSEQISAALRAELTPGEVDALAVIPTESQAAYDLYLQGNAAFDSDGLGEAADFLERAVAEDPDFALAWATLSMVHSAHYQFFEDRTPERLRRAEAAMDRAFELAPDLPEAHRAEGMYRYWGFRDYDAALRALDIAEQGLPSDQWVMSGQAAILRRMGRVEEGIRSYEQAALVNPLSPSPSSNLALLMALARSYERSRSLVTRTLTLVPDDVQNLIQRGILDLWERGTTEALRTELNGMGELEDWNGIITVERWRVEYFDGAHDRALAVLDSTGYDVLEYQTYYYPTDYLRGLSYQALGRTDVAEAHLERAREHLEEALAATPEEPRMLATLGRTLAALGRTERALAAARRAVEVYGPDQDSLDGPVYVWDLAVTQHTLGHSGQAIDELVRYFTGLGQWSVGALEVHPLFSGLADDPRWTEVQAASAAWDARMEAAGLR